MFEVGDTVIFKGWTKNYLSKVEFAGEEGVRGIKYLISYTNCNGSKVYRKARDVDLSEVYIEEGDTVKMQNTYFHDNVECKVEKILPEKDRTGSNIVVKMFIREDIYEAIQYAVVPLNKLELIEKGE